MRRASGLTGDLRINHRALYLVHPVNYGITM